MRMEMASHRQEILDAIKKFRLIDDEFFHSCFEGCIECMELLLRIILGKPHLIVTEMHTQQEVPNIFGREAGFDVFARDADGTEYNVEVQRADKGAVPKRARFNACMLDTMCIEKGTKWKDFPPNAVIFITENDVLGGGLPIYHIRRYIEELGFHLFEDASEIIYVNASYQGKTPLGWLLHDFRCQDPKDMHYKVLAERANFFKNNEHGVSQLSKIMEEIRENGVAETTRNIIRNLLVNTNLSKEEIAKNANTSVDEVIRIAKESGLAY